MTVQRVERHTYTLKGSNQVARAAELMAMLPNGWELVEFHYTGGVWVAVVQGPVTAIP